jgi:hypothetical protein
MDELKMYRGITIKFLGPTDYRGSRIKLIDERFNESVIIEYSHKNDMFDQSVEFLTKKGFKIVGFCEMKKGYVVFCDNWGDDCIKLKDIK